jgi:murein L,D-transpeptidase YcbB/YkuD
LTGGLAVPAATPVDASRVDPVASAIQLRLAASDEPGLGEFYRRRGYRPLWSDGRALQPAASRLPSLLRAAAADGLDPHAYSPVLLARAMGASRSNGPAALASLDLALSRAAAAWGRDLHRPSAEAAMLFVDPELPPPPDQPEAVLERVASAPSLEAGLAQLGGMHPEYVSLRGAIGQARAELGDERRRRPGGPGRA